MTLEKWLDDTAELEATSPDKLKARLLLTPSIYELATSPEEQITRFISLMKASFSKVNMEKLKSSIAKGYIDSTHQLLKITWKTETNNINLKYIFPWSDGLIYEDKRLCILETSCWNKNAVELCGDLVQFKALFNAQTVEMNKAKEDNLFLKFLNQLEIKKNHLYQQFRFLQKKIDLLCNESGSTNYAVIKSELMIALYGLSSETDPNGNYVIQSSGIAQGHADYEASRFFNKRPNFAMVFDRATLYFLQIMTKEYKKFQTRNIAENIYSIFGASVDPDDNKFKSQMIIDSTSFCRPLSIGLLYAETIKNFCAIPGSQDIINLACSRDSVDTEIKIDLIAEMITGKSDLRRYLKNKANYGILKSMTLSIQKDLNTLKEHGREIDFFLGKLDISQLEEIVLTYLPKFSYLSEIKT